jgi:transcription antitermination factor NusG
MKSYPTAPQSALDVLGWLDPVTTIDKYEIASRIALAGLDGFKGTLTADQQRKLFGRYIFGKMVMNISCTDGGTITGFRKVCFGTDWEDYRLSFDEIAAIVNNPDKSFSIAGRSRK